MTDEAANDMVDPATLEPVKEPVADAVQEALKPPPPPPKKKLQPCPCGKVPTTLVMEVQERSKYGRALGNCCGQWAIEFRNGYTDDQAESVKRATEAWDSAPRAA